MIDQSGQAGWIIGAISGAIIGGMVAAFMGESVVAGAVSGAISGVIAGAACDAASGNIIGTTIGLGVASAMGEYANQVGNDISEGKGAKEALTPNNWGEILEAGVIGAIFAPISLGGGKLAKLAMGENPSGIDRVAKGIAETIIDVSGNVVQEVTRMLF